MGGRGQLLILSCKIDTTRTKDYSFIEANKKSITGTKTICTNRYKSTVLFLQILTKIFAKVRKSDLIKIFM